jgi:hypothetical protein
MKTLLLSSAVLAATSLFPFFGNDLSLSPEQSKLIEGKVLEYMAHKKKDQEPSYKKKFLIATGCAIIIGGVWLYLQTPTGKIASQFAFATIKNYMPVSQAQFATIMAEKATLQTELAAVKTSVASMIPQADFIKVTSQLGLLNVAYAALKTEVGALKVNTSTQAGLISQLSAATQELKTAQSTLTVNPKIASLPKTSSLDQASAQAKNSAQVAAEHAFSFVSNFIPVTIH